MSGSAAEPGRERRRDWLRLDGSGGSDAPPAVADAVAPETPVADSASPEPERLREAAEEPVRAKQAAAGPPAEPFAAEPAPREPTIAEQAISEPVRSEAVAPRPAPSEPAGAESPVSESTPIKLVRSRSEPADLGGPEPAPTVPAAVVQSSAAARPVASVLVDPARAEPMPPASMGASAGDPGRTIQEPSLAQPAPPPRRRLQAGEALSGARGAAARMAAAARASLRAGFERLKPTAKAAAVRDGGEPSARPGRATRWAASRARVGAALARLRPTGRYRWARIAAVAVALVLLPLLSYVAYALATIPREGGMAAEPSPSAVFVSSDDGQTFATRGVVKGEKLSAGDVPDHLKNAVIAIEDRRFRSHPGLDLWGMGRAIVRNIGGGREGASTITQQLARLTYLSQERSLRRKVQEAALALQLDWNLSKDEILARYLNAAYFGGGSYGADAAARRYFGKPAKDLELGEAAMLAGLVRAPSQLAPHRNLEGARARAELVLTAMVETGGATAEQADAARKNPANVWEPPQMPPGTGYFVDAVEAETRRIPGAAEADVKVATTIDLRLQAAAERVVAKFLNEEGRAKNVSQAALVAMAPDGAILAMVGGRNYAESQFNRTSQAKRQAGSLFKLFVFLAALRGGADPSSVAVDAPTQIGEWEPENYGGRYRGRVTLKTAFANSINTVAVQLADAVGIDKVIETARGLGVASDLPKVPSLSLGSAEVTLLEMVRAYGTVLAGTGTVEPYAVRTVTRGDQPLYTRTAPPPGKPLEADHREALLEMLVAVVKEGTGKNARLPNTAVGGKTGTTQENRDAWFVGFTPDVTIGVWVGNDDNTPTRNVTGGDLPAKIWRAVAAEAVAGGPKETTTNTRRDEAALQPRTQPAPVAAPPLRGAALVRDTGTLEIAGQEVRLAGLEGIGGRAARDLMRYIRRRPVSCEADAGGAQTHRCIVDGQDLSRVILFNGGARASADAPADLREAEEQAREARVGVWRR